MKIPRKQSDIKAKTYIKYIEFIKTLTEEEKANEELILKITLKIFYNIQDEEFNNLPYSVILDLFQIIDNILKVKTELIPMFKLNGVEYAIVEDFDQLTFGEFIDTNTEDIIRQICILYRPVIKKEGKKYLIEKYNADLSNYELFKEQLTLDIVLSFINFFFSISKDLTTYILKSLKIQADIPTLQSKSLQENMDGIVSLLNYAMVISDDKTKLQS